MSEARFEDKRVKGIAFLSGMWFIPFSVCVYKEKEHIVDGEALFIGMRVLCWSIGWYIKTKNK